MAVKKKDIQNQIALDVDIRVMTYEDVGRVIAVEEQAYTHPWTSGIFKDCIRVGYSCWVFALRSSVVGYGIVMMTPGESHILNICVHPQYQGRGLGRKMLHHLVNESKQHGVDMVLLEVRRSNTAGIGLYQSEGFHELGVRKDYYPESTGREDAIIFAKYLPQNLD